jgi:hypothetical protein
MGKTIIAIIASTFLGALASAAPGTPSSTIRPGGRYLARALDASETGEVVAETAGLVMGAVVGSDGGPVGAVVGGLAGGLLVSSDSPASRRILALGGADRPIVSSFLRARP